MIPPCTLVDRIFFMVLSERDESGSYTLSSLFCGAGGLDYGLSLAGFKSVWANDSDRDSCSTFKSWSDATVVCGSIENLNFKDIPHTDVISGGFPCQGFSLAGPRKIDDRRNKLYRSFVKLVALNQPRAFIAENVKGILTMSGGSIFDAITADFENAGYTVRAYPCNAADYDVPQDRYRVIIIGIRNDLPWHFEFPEPLSASPSIGDALKNLPEPTQEEICDAPFSSRYMSRNRKRTWNERSYTIPAMAKQVPLHPSSPDMVKVERDRWIFGSGRTRRFSWREAAAIQTFPKDFSFKGDLTSIYRQIGNAVPVKLAFHVGCALKEALDSTNSQTPTIHL